MMNGSPSPLRVCHLGKYYAPASGGMETHVRVLARAQAELGARVQVYCVNHRPGRTIREMDGDVELVRFRRLGIGGKLDLCPGLIRALRNVQADVLHVHVPNPTMILSMLLARPRHPVVVTYHSDHVRQVVRGLLFRPMERLFYHPVRAILATSPAYMAGSSLLQTYPERVRVLPMGIELEPYLSPQLQDQEQAVEIQARYPGPIWLAAGRLTYYKGLHNALHALKHVPGTLLIAGEGPERRRLQGMARTLAVEERVAFLGYVRSLVPYYLAAHAFWFPSNARSEAFGLVQVEALASGCPVINADIPDSGVAWVSRNEETGLTVAVNDPEGLARAAQRLLTEPGLRERLSANARERVRSNFDHRLMAQRTLETYSQVLGGREYAEMPPISPSLPPAEATTSMS